MFFVVFKGTCRCISHFTEGPGWLNELGSLIT